MLENSLTLFNKDIDNEQVIKEIIHFASTKEISVKVSNENITDATVINNVTVSLSKSFDFQQLVEREKELEETLSDIPETKAARRLEISAKLNHQKNVIKKFVQDILTLAAQFRRSPLNTNRLRRAREFFERGEFREARAVFETESEQMQDEQAHWLREKEYFVKEVQPNLVNNSEEYLLFALTTQTDYTNPHRYEKARDAFERSIQSSANESNVFQYAKFLQQHNQFAEAEKYYSQYLDEFAFQIAQGDRATVLNNLAILYRDQGRYDEASKKYEEAMPIYRALAEADSRIYLPELAAALNNLAVLHKDLGKYDEALKEYNEALQMKRDLAEINADAYLPDVAMTLSNLGILYKDWNKYDEAARRYDEALQIRRRLEESNSSARPEDTAVILNNLGILHKAQGRYDEASKEYEEALRIRRKLAEVNPLAFQPLVAMTLNNLAILHDVQNKDEEAVKEYNETLQIRRDLAEINPRAYLPDVALTLNNLGILLQNQKKHDEAAKAYEESLQIRRKLVEDNPNASLLDVAVSLSNFASLHADQNEFEAALQKYEESTAIYRRLTAANFQAYFPYLAMNLSNIALFYQQQLPQREKSIASAVEVITILSPSVELVPFTQDYFLKAFQILRNWNLSDEEIQRLLAEKFSANEKTVEIDKQN